MCSVVLFFYYRLIVIAVIVSQTVIIFRIVGIDHIHWPKITTLEGW